MYKYYTKNPQLSVNKIARICTKLLRYTTSLHKEFTGYHDYIRSMNSDSFTLVLTNGTHTIDASNAELLNKAIEGRRPSVDVSIDLYGDGVRQTPVKIMVDHVVMIISNVESYQNSDKEYFGILSGKVRRVSF